jgi:hypothetical protein
MGLTRKPVPARIDRARQRPRRSDQPADGVSPRAVLKYCPAFASGKFRRRFFRAANSGRIGCADSAGATKRARQMFRTGFTPNSNRSQRPAVTSFCQTLCSAGGVAHPLIPCRVRFLLDDFRAQAFIDTPPHGRPAVVRLVAGTRQLDEPRAEGAGALAFTNLVLDSPQRFIDRLERGCSTCSLPDC